MKIAKLFAGIAIAAIALMGTAQAAPNLVSNGGFETGDFTGWTQSGNTGFSGVNTSTVHSGTYAAFFGPIGSLGYITQNIATTVGGVYSLQFFVQNSNTNNTFFVSWDGGTLVNTTLPDQDYALNTFAVTATGTSTALTFGFRNDPSFTRLDDVSVTARTVPEPASLALFGAGLVGLVMVRRRKRG